MGYGSNRGRPSEIGRPGRFGRAGRRRDVAGALLRGGGRPELGHLGLQTSVWAGIWPGRASVERVSHLATQGRGLGLGMSCAAAGRCWAMAGLVGDGVLTTRVAYTPL